MKRKPKFPLPEAPPRLAEIEWLDAALHPDFDGAAKDSPGRVVLRSAGYYVGLTKTDVILAMDFEPQGGTIRTTQHIGRRDVTRLTIYRPEGR